MSKQNDPQDQQRMQAVRRYMVALKRGDLAIVAAVLSEAEHDPRLESLLLKANHLYQARDGIAVRGDELLKARRFLSVLQDEVRIGTNYESLSGSSSTQFTTAGNNGTFHERRLQPMQIETQSSPPPSMPKRKATPPRKPRFPRAARFMQATAAVLIVGALIVSFLFVFSMRHSATRPKETTTGSQFHGIVAVLSTTSNYIFGLDPQKGAIIWEFNTHSSTQVYYPPQGSFVTQNRTVYAYMGTQGRLYALQATNGHLLWKTSLGIALGESSQESGTMVVDHGILFVIATDLHKGDIVFAVRASDGQILWHYQIGVTETLTAANGIVYLASENDPYHPQLLALSGTNGKEIWRYTTYPLHMDVINNVIYIYSAHVQTPSDNGGDKQAKMLLALNAQHGTLIWSQQVVDNQFSPMAIGNGLITLGLTPNLNSYQICAFSMIDGHQTWCNAHIPPQTGNISASSTMDGMFYASFPTNPGAPALALAFNMQNGKIVWSKNFDAGLGNIGLVTLNGVVYTAGAGVNALNSSDGHTIWHASMGDVVAIAAGS